MSEYVAQAETFLANNGLTMKAAYKGGDCPPWDDEKHIHGDKYRVTLKRGKCLHDSKSVFPVTCTCEKSRSVSFDFWNSYNDAKAGNDPNAYDVLACISSDVYCPETFKDFCDEYGYESDSIKALDMFRRCSALAKKLRGFFTETEIEQLSEIR